MPKLAFRTPFRPLFRRRFACARFTAREARGYAPHVCCVKQDMTGGVPNSCLRREDSDLAPSDELFRT